MQGDLGFIYLDLSRRRQVSLLAHDNLLTSGGVNIRMCQAGIELGSLTTITISPNYMFGSEKEFLF